MFDAKPLRRLFPVLLLNLIAFAVAIPILPALADELGGTATDIGFLFATQAFGQFLMAPVWGDVSDRFGRKWTLVATIAAGAAFELVTAFVTQLWVLYVARLMVGMCAGNIGTASALIADATEPEERSQGMAIIGISFGVGFTIGPAVGGAISLLPETYPAWFPPGPGPLGAGLPFVGASMIAVSAALLGAFLLVEPQSRGDEATRRGPGRLRMLLEHARSSSLALMCTLFFFYTSAIAMLEVTFFPYAKEIYGYDESEIGFIFAGMGLLMALIQGGIRHVSEWLGDRRMAAVGLACFALGLGLVPSWEIFSALLVFLSIATVGRALVGPGVRAMTSDLAEHDAESGKILGVLQSSSSLARIAGPALGGLIFEYVSPGAPFWGSSALVALVGTWWWLKSSHLDGDDLEPADAS